ncbi:MAG: hypothetical protein WBM80_07900 [Woeseiaceae bacterium]
MNQTLRFTLLAGVVVVLASIALPRVVVAQPTSRLLFAQQSEEDCSIGYWHSRTGETVILGRTPYCPDRLFVSRSRQIVFFVDGKYIRILNIRPTKELEPIPLPDLNHEVWLEKMDPRPDDDENYKHGVGMLLPIGIRYLEDGALAAVLNLGMPASDDYQFLFRLDDDGWSIIASRWCHRFGCENPENPSDPFHSGNFFSTVDSSGWPEERQVWHPSLIRSGYVVSRLEDKGEDSLDQYAASAVTLRLKIGDYRSVLTSSNWASEHSGVLSTFGVTLSIDSGPPKILSKQQCVTSIVGRYILVQEYFRGRFELTDLGTGETVMTSLSTAAWID